MASFHSAIRVPVLETARLKLRGHGMDDFISSAAMWADPAVTRHIGGRPLSDEESWARLLRHVGHWAVLGFGCWVVEEKATGSFVGEIGFHDYKRDMEPPLKGTPEIGWVIATQFHGKGFATEAVRAAIAWGEAHFGVGPTVCIIDPKNLASIHVAEKCGYRRLHVAAYKGQPTMVFVR